MSNLPKGLEPWASVLVGLRPELIGSLGDWLPRLSSVVGPLRTQSKQAFLGEPNGFDGLGRRGSWDHLLLSEWALADEVPDEFLRRAAMQEQLFLQPARIEPQGAKRVVLLFDAGPDQIGALRLVHLAVLLVMMRRTEQAGAALHWGHLQRPEKGLTEDYGQHNGKTLFRQRTVQVPNQLHRDAWLEKVGEDPDELWVVGGRDARLEGARQILVQDPYEPNVREVAVSLNRPGHRRAVELRLVLPDPHACSRSLRDPFARVVASSVATSSGRQTIKASIAFSATGSALFTHVNREICSWHVPDGVRGAKVRRKTSFDAKDNVIALGRRKRKLFVAYAEDGLLKMPALTEGASGWHPQGVDVRLPDGFGYPDASRALGTVFVLPVVHHVSGPVKPVVIQDANQSVWFFDLESGRNYHTAANAAPMSLHEHFYSLLVELEARRSIELFKNSTTGSRPTGLMKGRPVNVGQGPLEWYPGIQNYKKGCVVLSVGSDHWQVIRQFAWNREHESMLFKIPSEAQVFGCSWGQNKPIVFALSANRLVILEHSETGVIPNFTVDSPVISAKLSPGRPVAALWLANGTVVVYNPLTKVWLHQWHLGAP